MKPVFPAPLHIRSISFHLPETNCAWNNLKGLPLTFDLLQKFDQVWKSLSCQFFPSLSGRDLFDSVKSRHFYHRAISEVSRTSDSDLIWLTQQSCGRHWWRDHFQKPSSPRSIACTWTCINQCSYVKALKYSALKKDSRCCFVWVGFVAARRSDVSDGHWYGETALKILIKNGPESTCGEGKELSLFISCSARKKLIICYSEWKISRILSFTCDLHKCFHPVMNHYHHLSPFYSNFSDQSWYLGRAHTPPGLEK